jgi:hydroxyethylthiazole kinase-like uncharacterized protein yjeF
VIPVLTPGEMAGVDRRAATPEEVLIGRAGAAVAGAAFRYLGGAYGKRIVVVAGKGNNGNDGRAAAAQLVRRGASVRVIDAAAVPPGGGLPQADLVIDAAYGTGLGRPYHAPDAGGTPVLAVDIPSGLSGVTGEVLAGGDAVRATLTVTFASMKPGLLLGQGPACCGTVELVDIGLDDLVQATARIWLMEDSDAGRLIPPRPHNAHKWNAALQVVAGSPGMTGAPWMVSRAALRTGAGYVRLGMPGVDLRAAALPPGELVTEALPATGWDGPLRDGLGRFKALVVGPGLGPVLDAGNEPVARLAGSAALPLVLDADGINALGTLDRLAEVVAHRHHPTVITPHEGEYRRLVGEAPGADRISSVRDVARRSGAIVLLKGSTTVVAAPDGRVMLAAAGSSRLATAGTGDVLSGVIGALLARGVPALEAAGLGAHIHGRASGLGFSQGLVASDLPDLVARWLSEHVG